MKRLGWSCKFIAVLFISCQVSSEQAQSKPFAPHIPGELSVPAIFSQYVVPPGKMNHVKEPGRILFDPNAKELFVSDLGNNRILIFDSNSVFRFEFYCNEYVSSPMDLAVDGKGYIFVLGVGAGGKRIIKFDFDGMFMASFEMNEITGGRPFEINTMAVASDGGLYLLDESVHEVIVVDTKGRFSRRFPIGKFLTAKELDEMVYGSITLKDDLLYIPFSLIGTVAIYTLEGSYVRCVGTKGTAMGDLNFPVAVSINTDNIIHVLDRNRFNVVCYKQDGKFVGEFGGKGRSPGWYYFPNRITTNHKNQIIIGQVLNNVVQVCDPPPFLLP